jgi:hypothetical protein
MKNLPSMVIWSVIITIFVVITCFASCSNHASDKETRTNNIPDYLRIPEIKVHATHIQVINGIEIFAAGTAELPDGTYLQTQLYEDDMPIPWWDSDQTYEVKDGKFDIEGYMLADGVYHTLSKGPSYTLMIWEEANPAVNVGGISFDLVGPAPITT